MLKALCNYRLEKIEPTRCDFIRNKTKKIVPRAMRMKAEKAFSQSPDKSFKFLKVMKREEKDVESGKCI